MNRNKRKRQQKPQLPKSEQKMYREMIKDIMDNFDFNKVKKTMKALKWTWQCDETPPSLYEIMKTAEYVMKCAIDDPSGGCATGGFEACLRKDGTLRLSFYVDQAEAYESEHRPADESDWTPF